MKYKKYQAARESNPAFTLNQIGKIAFNRAKAGERYQQLEIITAQLMCALTMEAVLNHLGKKLFENWEEIERRLSPKDKLKMIAERAGLEIDLGSRPFQFLPEIFGFRDNLVHAKYSRLSASKIHESEIDENGFPVVQSVQELLTDWEKLCSIETAEKWRKAVESISSVLSEAARCQDPIKVDGAIDTWGELEV
jgi:hypothetical protein